MYIRENSIPSRCAQLEWLYYTNFPFFLVTHETKNDPYGDAFPTASFLVHEQYMMASLGCW